MELSVVLVTFNSAAQLPDCAAGLTAALAGRPAQIVVVDNCSADDSAGLARRLWPTGMVITNPVNRGFAAAVNQGLTVATGQALLLLNPDASPAPGAIERLLDHLAQWPTVGIVAPRLLGADDRGVLSAYPFLSPAFVAWRHWQLSRRWPDRIGGRYRQATLGPTASAPVTVDWAQGACLLIRRRLLEEIGPLDERFVLYCEEVDLCRRAALAGWRTDYLPGATVRHREGSSSQQVVPLKLASHYYSKVLYFEKHHPGWPSRLVRLILLLDLLLRIGHRTFGILVGRPADAALRRQTYWRVARQLLTRSAAQIEQTWRAAAAGAVERPDPARQPVTDHS